jgi:hypothetical protein
MRYSFVRWIHSIPTAPLLLLAEIDDAGFESRKIDIYPNGQISYATRTHSDGATFLSYERYPDLSEINASAEFDAISGSAEVFEWFWRLAVGSTHPPSQ